MLPVTLPLSRLLAPGYTETHYAPDGRPVVLAPNHKVRCFHGLWDAPPEVPPTIPTPPPSPTPAWHSLVLLQLKQELLAFSLQGHQPHVWLQDLGKKECGAETVASRPPACQRAGGLCSWLGRKFLRRTWAGVGLGGGGQCCGAGTDTDLCGWLDGQRTPERVQMTGRVTQACGWPPGS